MKILKPCNRENKRYLLITGNDASKENIDIAMLEFLGVLGCAEACRKFIRNETGNIVMAINHRSLDKIRTSFFMSKKDIRIKKVSGSLKKLE
jgi:RNase P/RNase MRP subunit POP5